MPFVEWLHKGRLPRASVGGKGAALSELFAAGFNVPAGFCVTAEAYLRFARYNPPSLRGASETRFPGQLTLPSDLLRDLEGAYAELAAMSGEACAVRSSTTAEDGADRSYAGLYESYLNVKGAPAFLDAVCRCFASLQSDRALAYRSFEPEANEDVMAVVVMRLVSCEAAGVAFTAHPVTGLDSVVVINSSWGLGEAVVSGLVTPDSFEVAKQTLALQERDIFEKATAVYPDPDADGTIERELSSEQALAPSLTDEQAREVARLAMRVEEHFGAPQDIEWGLSSGELFLLQARPITTLS